MPIIEDDLWRNPGHPGMIVVTAHATINQDGLLIMDSGAALQATQRIPGIERQCANEILTHAKDGIYGFLPVRPARPNENKIGFGLFQTRRSLEDSADLRLIKYSIECMQLYLEEHSKLKMRMNYPGIQSGGPSVDQVAPLLSPLSTRVTICHRGEVLPQAPKGIGSAKDLYYLIERWLQEGRFNMAVDFLANNGFDPQSALDQVMAVQRDMRQRSEKFSERRQSRWEQSVYRLG